MPKRLLAFCSLISFHSHAAFILASPAFESTLIGAVGVAMLGRGFLVAPIPRAAVMLVETRLVVTIKNGCLIILWTGFYLFLGQIDVDSGIGLNHVLDPFRRDQHCLTWPPICRIDQQIT